MSDDLMKRGREIFERGLPEDVRRFGQEAADEIERLQAECTRLVNSAQKLGAVGSEALERAKAAEAEVARLKKMLKEADRDNMKYASKAAIADVEVARLRKALRACLSREVEHAEARGLNDCCCIMLSRKAETEYETGKCPHQRAAALLRCEGCGGSGQIDPGSGAPCPLCNGSGQALNPETDK